MSADFGLLINALFTVVMAWLAWRDYRTFGSAEHRDFKSIIMSAGVLGTFVGIFIGLWEFDTARIEDSVPPLLEGLKVAFYTSILGMGLAILLSILQKGKSAKSSSEESLEYITLKSEKLDYLEYLAHIPALLQAQNATLERIESFSREKEDRILELLNYRFVELKDGLDAAFSQLSRGASAEIVSALERVISDFNSNLSEQFGDNFKELNAATLKMIAWQENYKESIAMLENSLKSAQNAMDSASGVMSEMVKNRDEMREFYSDLGALLRLYRDENSELNAQLSAFGEMRREALVSVEAMGEIFGTSSQRLKNLGDEIGESLNATRENLSEHIRLLQEDSKKEVRTFLALMKRAQEGLDETLNEQNSQLKEHIAREVSQGREALSEQFGGVSLEFSGLLKALREELGASANDVLGILKKSSDETSQHILEQERLNKESTLALFNKIRTQFEKQSEGFLALNKLANENLSKESKQLWESFFSEWRAGVEASRATLVSSSEQVKGSFDSLAQSALGGLMMLSKALEGGIDGVKNSVIEMNKNLAQNTLELSKKQAHAQLELLKRSAESISQQLANLENEAQKSLKNIALEYVKVVEKITKDSVRAPKEAGEAVVEQFEILQREVVSMITSTNDTLLANKCEIEGILKILQDNVSSSLESTSAVNENLVTSLKNLDSALGELTGDFRRDYEWFLRRIRELIGSRSAL